MPNRPISITEANTMIKAYNTYMQALGVDMKKQTESVGFTLSSLLDWLNKINNAGLADEIRICMGEYPDGNAQAGRTTVILWPFKDGQPARYPAEETATTAGINGDEGEEDDEDGNAPPPPPPPGKEVDPYNDGQLHP
ncbi:MAG: hypothetical protein EOO01_05345 [Chitinophagaceae bacterium]|nr:MAG: hypothetical protein EOO01_05345 [Chitinophagaceae bacterium]